MKRYFLLSCIVAIMPIVQSVSARAADFFGPGIAPSFHGGGRGGGWSGGGWGGCG